jgi:DNA-binding MurR/RpiR family transcriptional regulator
MRTPKNFDEFKSEIARRHDDLSRRLRQIAEFALHHPNDMAFGTVAIIAESAGVQPSSIVRFANSFGFDGFSDMQRVFRSRLLASAASYRERIAAIRDERSNGRSGETSPGRVLEQFVGDGVAALEQLPAQVRAADVERALVLMDRARDIYVLAQGRAFPVAYYIHYALIRLDRRATLLDGLGGMVSNHARVIGRDDLLIAISFKVYAPEVARVVGECAGRGIKIVAVTDSALSPIAKHASVRFELGDDIDHPFRSLIAPMCLAQSLVVAFGHHLANRPN